MINQKDSMKIVIITVLLALGFHAQSQEHFLKFDLVGPIRLFLISNDAGMYKLTYEYNYSRHNSFSVGIEKGILMREIENVNGSLSKDAKFSGLGIVPEYRYYFASPTRMSTAYGGFIGVYTRILSTSYHADYPQNSSDNFSDKSYAVGAGISGGAKFEGNFISKRWEVPGMFYEIAVGFGYGIVDSEYYDQDFMPILSAFSRFEFNVGYAF